MDLNTVDVSGLKPLSHTLQLCTMHGTLPLCCLSIDATQAHCTFCFWVR